MRQRLARPMQNPFQVVASMTNSLDKLREYMWKMQRRESETDPWEDVKFEGSDWNNGMIRVYSEKHTPHGFNIPERKRNSFIIKDGAPIPEIVHRVAAGLPSEDYFVRTILESKDDDGKPLIKVIHEYSKLNPDKKIETDDGIAFAVCKQCGEKMVPERARQHLIKGHDIRQKIAFLVIYLIEGFYCLLAFIDTLTT